MPAEYSTIPQSADPLFLVPSGGIIMWSGLIADIPPGWVLCDGTNSTPDLRDRFIIGAPAATEAGGLTGALTHLHAGHDNHAALESHAHTESVRTLLNALHHGVATHGLSIINIGDTAENTKHFTPSGVTEGDLTTSNAAGTPDAHSAHDAVDARPPTFDMLFMMKT